jgi:hypothetical protein
MGIRSGSRQEISHSFSSLGLGLPSYHVFIVMDDVGAAMVFGSTIRATSTSGFRSLGLSMAHRVVLCRNSAHLLV